MSSLDPPEPQDPLLTPNTLSEVEMALKYNELYQTSSAGRPQPTTPLGPSRQSSNYYATAALKHGIDPAAPHPPSFLPAESTDSGYSVGEHDADGLSAGAVEAGKLSRGTTQAVLEKMASSDFDGSLLRKRGSREGERRTRLVPVKSGESIPDTAFDRPAGDGEVVDGGGGVKKLGFDRQGSWSQEDMKRVMTERLMAPVGEEESAGYSSAGGGET